jgi:hypothetical protein
MNKLGKVFSTLLAGKVSIVIYILMFIYLVLIPLVAFLPGLDWLMPSTPAMLIGDNYTSVLAALSASIAAGAGVAVHSHAKTARKRQADMQKSIDDLHAKIDRLGK